MNRPFRAACLGGCRYPGLRPGLYEPGLQPGKPSWSHSLRSRHSVFRGQGSKAKHGRNGRYGPGWSTTCYSAPASYPETWNL